MQLINKNLLQSKYIIPATGAALVVGGMAANMLNKPKPYIDIPQDKLNDQDIQVNKALKRLSPNYPDLSIQYEGNNPYLLNNTPPSGQPKQVVWKYMNT
jgi:hypothetical protein